MSADYRFTLLVLVSVTAACVRLCAAEITGTVKEISGSTATVEPSGGTPAVGDTADIFFKLAGVDEEISVANGSVTSLDGTLVKVKIENASGDVAKEQQVRFLAGKGAPVTAATPSTMAQLPALTGTTAEPTPGPAAPTSGYIGVQVTANSGGGSGALVVSVPSDSPAGRAGIVAKDVIMAVDGSPVEDWTHLVKLTSELAIGSKHALLVSRDGKLQKIDVTVDSRPSNAVADVPASTADGTTSSTSSLPPSVPFPSVPPTGEKNAAPVQGSAAELAAASPFVNKGNAQYSAGNIAGAIASYTEGMRAAPSVAVLYLNRANAYLYQPNFKAALADVNRALELKIAQTDDAYVIRGTAKASQGDYAGGIADCNRAIKINPKHALAYNNRANNKLRQRDYRGALADCEKSISLNSKMPLGYYNRGFARYNLGNNAGALSDWKKAVQMQASFGAELNPKIAQLEAAGVRSQAPAPKAPTTTRAGPGDWVDLTNAPRKIIGTWLIGTSRTRFSADGTYSNHAAPGQAPTRGQWQIQGDRLTQTSGNNSITHQILSLDGAALVIRNPQGQTFRLTKSK